jgi:hypothetical protein|tara:strand:+ start:340 stop:483 length:144 start_codon:yes stop_codon:yes gene_type:complete
VEEVLGMEEIVNLSDWALKNTILRWSLQDLYWSGKEAPEYIQGIMWD